MNFLLIISQKDSYFIVMEMLGGVLENKKKKHGNGCLFFTSNQFNSSLFVFAHHNVVC